MAGKLHPEEAERRPGPFLKALADLYDFLGMAVLASVGSSAVTLTAGLLAGWVWQIGGLARACAPLPLLLLPPVACWGLSSLAVACAAREDPSWRRLLSAVGRVYPRVLLYGVMGPGGAAIAAGTAALWATIGTPALPGASSTPLGVAVGALWAGAGLAWVCVWMLGWSIMAMSGARVGYSLRLAAAAVSAGPGTALLFAGHLAAALGVLLLPLVVSWQGIGIGLCIMFVVFIGPFYIAVLSANVALHLVERVRDLKERLEAEQNTPAVEEQGADDA